MNKVDNLSISCVSSWWLILAILVVGSWLWLLVVCVLALDFIGKIHTKRV